MVHFSSLLIALSVAGSVTAAPATQFNKRIAQNIPDSTKKWEAACDAANGGAQCNQIAVKAFGTLLAGAGDCDQQNNADIMMTLSKKLNSQQMISLTQIFAQQPRNSPNSLSIPYCQQKPQNAELNGFFQCQFQGVNPTKFANGNTVGQAGTIPLGQTAPVNPPGSCPANPTGTVAAGQQLDAIVQSPGVPEGSSAGNSSASAASPASGSATQATSSSAASAANTSSVADASAANTSSVADASAANTSSVADASAANTSSAANASSPTPSAAANSSASGSGSDFKAQNGKDAQALNQKFQSLTADSACTDGEQACVQGQFAQCSGGKFALTPCSGGLTCTALPLVNKPGTSVTCDSQADAAARVSQALGSRAAANSSASGFKAQNGKDAQALNQKFQSLTADSACTDGEQACVQGQFAQCSGGKFALTPCSGGLTCTALPLVNKPGTSVTCDSQADAAARVSQALGSRAAANSSASGFKAQNGKDAQALNQKFQSLTADSACTDGEQACVQGQFAQCSGGKFALTPCSGGLTCTALPLVNKPGTSVTCDTQADSTARIAQALGS